MNPKKVKKLISSSITVVLYARPFHDDHSWSYLQKQLEANLKYLEADKNRPIRINGAWHSNRIHYYGETWRGYDQF